MKRPPQDARQRKAAVVAHGSVLPALVRVDSTGARRVSTTATPDGNASSSTRLILRAAARHSQAATSTKWGNLHKPAHSSEAKGLSSLPPLEPVDRTLGLPARRGNNNASDTHTREEDAVLAEIWRVAATTGKGFHTEKALSPAATSVSNNDCRQQTEKVAVPHEVGDGPPSSGTTLARYRRLVGMHARKTLFRILEDAAKSVMRKREEEQAGVCIQRVVRRFLGRRRRERWWYDHVMAVETVARAWRATVARRELHKLRQEAHARQRAETQALEAIRTIQQRFRFRTLVRRDVEKRMVRRRQEDAEVRSRSVLARAVGVWARHRRRRETPLQLSHTGECPGEQRSSRSFAGARDSRPRGLEADVVIDPLSLIDGHTGVRPRVMDVLCSPTVNVETSHADLVENRLWRKPERCQDTIVHELNETPPFLDIARENDLNTAVEPLESALERIPPLQASSVHLPTQHEAIPSTSCILGQLVCRTQATRTLRDSSEVARVKPDSFANYDLIDTSNPRPMTLPSDTTHELETADTIEMVPMPTLRPSHLAERHATRILTRFVVSHWLPHVRSRLSTIHSAATRIQQRVRQRLAWHQLAHRRQLALVSLRSQLETHWLTSEATLLASIFGSTAADEPHTQHATDNDPDDTDLVFDVDEDEEQTHGTTAGLTWADVLPTRNGYIPHGLRVDFSRGGPASCRAPTLGLWKWSWPTEQWEPRRDLFQLHTKKSP